MKPTITYILIADEGSARIVENRGPGKGVFQVAGKAYKAKLQPEPADQPGRSFNSAGAARHKLEPHGNSFGAHDVFATELIDELSRAYGKGEFHRLVIAAAPKMLSQLRQHLPQELKANLVAEIAKDLTHIPTTDLAPHIGDVLAV